MRYRRHSTLLDVAKVGAVAALVLAVVWFVARCLA